MGTPKGITAQGFYWGLRGDYWGLLGALTAFAYGGGYGARKLEALESLGSLEVR